MMTWSPDDLAREIAEQFSDLEEEQLDHVDSSVVATSIRRRTAHNASALAWYRRHKLKLRRTEERTCREPGCDRVFVVVFPHRGRVPAACPLHRTELFRKRWSRRRKLEGVDG